MSSNNFLKDKWAKFGLAGTITAALCCFTPILVWIFAALGLAAFTAYLDYVLLPLLFVSLAVLGFAYNRYQKQGNQKNASACDCDTSSCDCETDHSTHSKQTTEKREI